MNGKAIAFWRLQSLKYCLKQCENIEEAIVLINKLPHRYCYNYSMTDQSGKAVVEGKNFINRYVADERTTMSVYHHFNNGDSPSFVKQYQEYFGTLQTVIGIGENFEPQSFSH
ncbi:carcinine hydrolase/isopenicillin-N N-acyltransferase family protein [Lysinibacillus mangiferihumi]|nr:carcinine hydrolase/isopenicillin-N N-acyltransferase family protein [Lysinibacillus mangiferihumi]